MLSPGFLSQRGLDNLPNHLGIAITALDGTEVRSELPLRATLMAPNGFLHAGSVIALADTSAGYGCFANLPDGATGFTTVEVKSNHVGTARDGTLDCVATAAHLGRSTQVWDATVRHRESGRVIALFRCTQMILYAQRPAAAA